MDVKHKYEGLVAAGELRLDQHQLRVVEQLQALQRQLDGYQLPSPSLLWKVGQPCTLCVRIKMDTHPTGTAASKWFDLIWSVRDAIWSVEWS